MLLKTEWLMMALLVMCACSNMPDEKTESETAGESKAEQQVQNGPYMEFYGDGELRVTGEMKNGQRVGLWSGWHRNGQLQSEMTYDRGKRTGAYRVWHTNGQLRIEGQYVEDKEVGTWTFYDTSGTVIKTQSFE